MFKHNLTAYEYQEELKKIGIKLDVHTGHLFYDRDFKAPSLNFELVFVRHGETYGNCGQGTSNGNVDYNLVNKNLKDVHKRIFQGDVDNDINQLTEYGRQQACNAAKKLKDNLLKNGWKPDIIFSSPLKRARQTALPFITENNFESRFIIHSGIKEMSFGAWDNCRVDCMRENDPCHSFYREQHALVKCSGKNAHGLYQEAENFCDVLLRAQNVLKNISIEYHGKKILMFSHSMFGAACCILAGKGQKIESGEYLAFDGKRQDGSFYIMPHAEPFFLNFGKRVN